MNLFKMTKPGFIIILYSFFFFLNRIHTRHVILLVIPTKRIVAIIKTLQPNKMNHH